MKQNPSFSKGENLPVDSVSWESARMYCRNLTKIERAAGRLPDGYVYRLPTEAEWEYVARAGTTSPFSFGDRANASNGNFRGVYPIAAREKSNEGGHYGSRPVGSYSANAFGLYDIHGNVGEWTLDHFGARLNGGSLTDPRPREDGRRVAVRGGSSGDFAIRVRSAAREEILPETKGNAIGFRVVLARDF